MTANIWLWHPQVPTLTVGHTGAKAMTDISVQGSYELGLRRLKDEIVAKDREIERLTRENDALYDMMRDMKINLTKILDGRCALEPKP
jgi:hypothetical protein